MFNKRMKKFAAAALAAALLMSAGAYGVSDQGSAQAAQESEDNTVKLNIAGAQEEAAADTEEEAETETETEEQTEAKKEYETIETTRTEDKALMALDVSGVVENTMPSIVAITGTTVQEVQSYFYGTQQFKGEGAGSGIIIAQNEDELLIATNNHVVADTTDLTVCFTVSAEDSEDLLVPAVVKGTSSKYDLAVIAVKLSDIKDDVYKQIKIATLGKSSDLKVGEASIVIGNALGTGQTVTTGIISALEREIQTEAGTFTEIQTDAAINLGCSGGAILNAKGEVIGITDAKATEQYAESMGYGIPIDTAVPVLQDLINRQTRTEVDNHGFLGVTVVPVSEEAKNMYNMPAGAFVYEVPEGSGADEAGIRKGDIITKFDGIDISSSTELVDTIRMYEAGETVKVEIQRQDGGAYTTQEVEVELQEGSEEALENENQSAQQPLMPEEDPSDGDDQSGADGEGSSPAPEADDFGQFFFGGGQDGGGSFNGWF